MCDKCNCNCKAAGAGLAAFVLGALIGAAVGVLYAPAKGETTRKKLKRWANDTYEDNKEYLLEHAQDLKEKATKEFNRRKDEIVAKFKKEENK